MGVLEERQVADQRWRAEVDRRLEDHDDEHAEFRQKFALGNQRFADGEARMTSIEAKLNENNTMTASIQTGMQKLTGDTDLIVKWVKNLTGFKNVLDWAMGMLVRVAVVICAAGVVWWFVKDGTLPKKVESDLVKHPVMALFDERRVPRSRWARRRVAALSKTMPPAVAAGTARPSSPVSVFAEDFSLLIRHPRRMRIARSRIRVLS